MSLNVQGSNLYVANPANDVIIEVGCVTNLSGLTASRDQLDVTCISDEARRFEAGLLTPGAASFSINFDPDDSSHVLLHEWYRSGVTLDWALGLSDGTAPPTLLDSNGNFNLTTSRTYITFEGYISDFPWDLTVGAKVSNALSIQVADFPVLHPKA